MLKRDYDDDEMEEGGTDDWLASYSDLITDLLAVFVLLFSFALLSQGATNKKLMQKISALDGGSSLLDEGEGYYQLEELSEQTPAQQKDQQAQIEELIKELRGEVSTARLDGQIEINKRGLNQIIIRMVDSILFDTGKANLKPEVQPLLENIADILDNHESAIKLINVEGHTDDRPIQSTQFPSNWELSTGRAGRVVRYLIEKTEIPSNKFSSSGYGEFRPIADNTTEAGRVLNRRVEIAIELNDVTED